MEAFSLLEVNQFVKRVLALNFDEPFWVECEINQVSHSKGNVYLNLIEKAEDSDDVVAKNSATIWYRQYLFIKKKLDKLIDSILSEGIMVKLKVTLNYSERYGLSLNIEDIDPAYTFGQFEMNRQKIIEKLKQKDLLDKNSYVDLPLVIQRVAVISSSTAAGFQDFKQQLFENDYGYEFDLVLFQSAMQGQKTEGDIVAAIQQIQELDFDAIVIIRGGGSKLDLSSFDNYNIAFEIAMSRLPVITGIGHDIDMTVTDMVAHSVLKTPTAVADMIISHNVHFESVILGMESEIFGFTTSIIADEYAQLEYMEDRLRAIPEITLSTQFQILDKISDSMIILGQGALRVAHAKLESKEELIKSLSPAQVLERGYAIVRQKEKIVTRKSIIKKGSEEVEIEFHDGTLKAKI